MNFQDAMTRLSAALLGPVVVMSREQQEEALLNVIEEQEETIRELEDKAAFWHRQYTILHERYVK